jgi:hypothetical protein
MFFLQPTPLEATMRAIQADLLLASTFDTEKFKKKNLTPCLPSLLAVLQHNQVARQDKRQGSEQYAGREGREAGLVRQVFWIFLYQLTSILIRTKHSKILDNIANGAVA